LKRSNRLVLLIGIFLALVAFVLIVVSLGGNNNKNGPSASPTTTTIVVATRDIDLGATIKDNDVKQDTVAISDFPPNGIKLTSLVVGQIARAKVTSGQAITTDVLEGSTGAITNIEVPKGFLAMAVQVDQTTGVGTIIKSGDYVDMVTGFTGTDKVPLVEAPVIGGTRANATPAPRGYVPEVLPYNSTTVKILVQGIQVLGTLLPPPTQAQGATPNPEGGTTTLNGQQQIVILAVSPQDAEIVKFAQIDGNISLVLRSSVDCQAPDASASPSPSPSASPGVFPLPSPSPSIAPGASLTNCPIVPTTGITLRRLVDDRGVLPPPVVEVIQPTPYPIVAP
jgi:Flp pilus assembly protein CpaB